MPMSDDDFEQKLKELGYQGKNFSSVDEATSVPESDSMNPADVAKGALLGATDVGQGFLSGIAGGLIPSKEATTSQPAADTADMDKLDQARLQAAQTLNPPSSTPAPSPVPPNLGAAEEQANAQNPDFQTQFPSPTPGPQTPATQTAQHAAEASPTPAPSSNPFESNPELNDAAIKKAQEQSRLGALVANIGNAGSTFSALASGNKPEETYFENLAKQANVPVEQIMQRRDALMKNMTLAKNMLDYQATKLNVQQLQQTNDPNSDVSKAARGLVIQFEPKLSNVPGFDKMSASEVKEFADHFVETESKVEASKANRLYTQSFKENQIENQKAQFNAREEDKIGKEVNALSTNSRSALGLAGRNLIAADRALGVLDQKTVTPQDLNTVSADISGIISGTPTVSGSRSQEYNTLAKSASSFWQQLTSNPTDVNTPAIKQHLKDVIQKMRDISTDTINKNIESVKSAHPTFVKNNPDYFENVAKTFSGQFGAAQNNPATPSNQASANKGQTVPANNAVQPSSPQQPALVAIRNKKTGTIKNLDQQIAAKYLADPKQEFEKVQ